MQNKALIWDLDGTLFDSYPIIVSILHQALEEHGIQMAAREIHQYVIRYSVRDFVQKVAEEYRCPPEPLAHRFSQLQLGTDAKIHPMCHAPEILNLTAAMGVSNFVYTHKGPSANQVLERMQLRQYFTEIVTSQNGFQRKPSAEAVNYLVQKYQLNRQQTYYVGDRILDVECAKNAGIQSILFLSPDSCGSASGQEDYLVQDLLEIADILKWKKEDR